MRDVNIIISNILSKEHKILNEIQQESIDVYIFILEQYKKGNILNNHIFQFIFRSFYGLDNAGLSIEQKEKFFKLLKEKQNDLNKILDDLYEIPNRRNLKGIQFVFATKLLNMLDSNSPIYDSQVANVIGQRVMGITREEKIQSCKEIFRNLESLYKTLLDDKRIKNIISKFRVKYDKQNKCSDAKILDFILWGLGKINQLEKKNAKRK